MLMACWKLGPALATGNSVVLKTSEKSPLTAIRMAQLAIEAGIPQGVLNVLPGFGHTVGMASCIWMWIRWCSQVRQNCKAINDLRWRVEHETRVVRGRRQEPQYRL